MKLMSWNVEHMNRWFEPDKDGPASLRDRTFGVSDVPRLATRVAQVIQDIDPDILAIQEGPSRRSEMALFVERFLDDAYDIAGPTGRYGQYLFTLIKKGGAVTAFSRQTLAGDGLTVVDLDDAFKADLDGDLTLSDLDFTRAPLVLDVTDAQGKTISVINMHLRSKYVSQGPTLWNTDRPAFLREAVRDRRQISAEANRVRAYVNALFGEAFQHARSTGQGEEPRIVVLGDLNDGPGQDRFEQLYLTHNVIATIAGSPFQPRRMLRHAFIDKVNKEDNYSYIFDDYVEGINDRPVLLDHILLSAQLYFGPLKDAGIAHDVYQAAIDTSLPGENEKAPSDHRPVFAELT